VREAKVLSEPDALIAWFGSLGFGLVLLSHKATVSGICESIMEANLAEA
jgi:hypothetical protein